MSLLTPIGVHDDFWYGLVLGLCGQWLHLILYPIVGGVLVGHFDRGVSIDAEVLGVFETFPALVQLAWMLPLALIFRRAPRALRGLAAAAALVAVANVLLWLWPRA